jgi:DNA processing protein
VTIREFAPEDLLGPLNEVEQKNAPRRLFVAGDVSILQRGARVSIVGTRKATPEGADQAKRLAHALASEGVVVVSGLAEGIDTAAHEGALEAAGRTIGIIGTPLDVAYPRKNKPLQDRLSVEHLVISQFPTGSPTGRGNFPMRNRTMALIADATVIVEAGEGSGTLHQGWEALRLGRPLFLLDAVLADPSLEWPGKMMGYGAEVLSLDKWRSMFDFLPAREGGEELRLAQ